MSVESSNMDKKLLKIKEIKDDKLIKMENKKINNEFFESDVEYVIQIIRWLLKPLGLWPKSLHNTLIELIISYLLMVICIFLLGFLIIPGSLFTFVKIKDFGVRLKLTGPLSFCVMGILKYYFLIIERSNIEICINNIKNDWKNVVNSRDRDIMINHAQFGRYGAVVCSAFMYSGGLFYALILPYVSARSDSGNNTVVKPLAYPSYYVIFDPQISPNYEIVFVTHCFCAFVMHSVTSTTCSIAVVFVMHACGQLEILIIWLKDLVDGNESKDDGDDRFSQVINQHVRTLGFIVRVEGILREICLVEVAGCTLNICLIGYYLMIEWEQADAMGFTTYTILLVSFIFNIFLFCYIGELLTEEARIYCWLHQCKKVGETTYMIEWYRLPEKRALGLKLIISTAQHPVTITAGRMIELSLNSFCTVLRTAAGYLNLLRTVMPEK